MFPVARLGFVRRKVRIGGNKLFVREVSFFLFLGLVSLARVSTALRA